MEIIWLVGLIALWGVVLVNLLLTLRVVRWLRAIEDLQKRQAEAENIPELPIGAPAPDFRAKTLSGESVRLTDYAGRAIVFVFVSPACGPCREEIPVLVKLGPLAKRRAGVELVLVSDHGTAETHSWIGTLRREDGVKVNLPTLVAPRYTSEFFITYNPRGFTPYFCYIDEQGTIQTREPLGGDEWSKLRREWEGSRTTGSFARSLGRYR